VEAAAAAEKAKKEADRKTIVPDLQQLEQQLRAEVEAERAEFETERAEFDTERQEVLMVGLLQGLSYLHARRVDLSEVSSPITEAQLEKIGSSCPDLDAIFFHPNHPPPQPALVTLKQACPKLHCGMLGCEITAPTYQKLLEQAGQAKKNSLARARAAGSLAKKNSLARASATRLDLTGSAFAALTDDGLAEVATLFPSG
jgi:hypothetical protein